MACGILVSDQLNLVSGNESIESSKLIILEFPFPLSVRCFQDFGLSGTTVRIFCHVREAVSNGYCFFFKLTFKILFHSK